MKTILITAYAASPFKGSEDATGWNISKEIAKENKVILITRKNNLEEIKTYLSQTNDPVMQKVQFLGFDLPRFVLWLKKRSGARGYVLYFYLWQMFVAAFVRRKGIQFDIAHSLNFHSDSHPNFLWMLGKPTFWGPVGHHPKVPKEYLLKTYGWKRYLTDRTYYTVKWMMRNLDPFYRLSVWKSEKIFVINSSIKGVVGSKSDKFIYLPAVATRNEEALIHKTARFNVLFVGRFHYIKGVDVAIRSFAKFYRELAVEQRENVSLTLVGGGPEEKRLRQIATEEGISDIINWVLWVDHASMHKIYKKASAFLFPSHEGAGMVVPEALSYGIPIVCFNNYGPGELSGEGGLLVDYTNYNDSITHFANRLNVLFTDKAFYNDLRERALASYWDKYTWEYKSQVINQQYTECA